MPKLRSGASVPAEEPTKKALVPYQRGWKKGQSGNPNSRNNGAATRRNYISHFIDDLYASWKIYGRPALMTAALTDPVAYLRVAASLIPKEIEITVTSKTAERLSDDDLAGYLEGPDSADTIEAQANEEVLQPVE
jgi:hypothetical protein